MRIVFLLLLHLLVTIARLIGPGGVRAVLAESLTLKHQLLIANRSRKRAPNLTPRDRALLGICSLLIRPHRLGALAVVVSIATLFKFHDALKKRKYQRLFGSQRRGKPGPNGPAQQLIDAIVEMKTRNPRFGCPRIAQQLARAFGIEIDTDVVRRVLGKHYRPLPGGGNGPSWLSIIGHIKDSLWSVDLFQCESILLQTHFVMVVMDQFTRRIIGVGVHVGDVDGPALCRMFNAAIAGAGLPAHLSSDNDPLFLLHRWKANLRILEIDEIKTVAHVPVSHPFIERLIGSVRREYLDQVLFWNVVDLQRKLKNFQDFYNEQRTHAGIDAETPAVKSGAASVPVVNFNGYRWQKHCRGVFHLPIAA